MKTEYVIVSKFGMTPFARVATAKAAEKEARKARRLGLDGRVVKYVDGKRVDGKRVES